MRWTARLALAAMSTCSAATAFARDSGDEWSFEFSPYLLAAGMDGSTQLRGVRAEVDMGFDEILDHLDTAFLARFEASRGNWGLGLEGVYFRLKGEEVRNWSGPLGNTNTAALNWTAIEKLFQSTVYYEVLHGDTKLDVLVAARYTELDPRLTLSVSTGAPLLPDGSREVRSSESWVDPVVGARLRAPLSDQWYVLGLADIGGFGAGADLTWQLFASLGWQFAEQFSLELGYRYLHQDYADNDFAWDVDTSGPQLGLSITW
jgi:hypothetical protein